MGAALAVIVVGVAAVLWLRPGGWRSAGTAAETNTASIAVLPFVDMSPEKNQEYFSDGLAEELLNALAKIPGLRVTARTSSFQFKGKAEDVRTVGKKLNVGAILEGSVRKADGRVRITAQLIKTADGFHLWSETYDRELHDIFAVQEEIAQAVASSLQVRLLGGKAATPTTQPRNVEAYNAYLQGRYFFERHSKESLETAVGYYEQAIKLDSGYASAWAGLAWVYGWQAASGYLPVDEGYRNAREAAERALALDGNLAEAHAAIGFIKTVYDWDWAGADASYQRALALEPRNATLLRQADVLPAALGRFDEALALDRRAMELDPLNPSGGVSLGQTACYAGRLDEAVAALKKALELAPDRPHAHSWLGRVYLELARPQEALAEMNREPDPLWRLHGQALAYHALKRKKDSDAALREFVTKYHAEAAFQIAEVYAFRGETDQAFEWLERAYTQRDSGLAEIKGDPLLKSLEHDPRYAAFLKKMHLPI
jgi:TolB-like protein